MNRVPVALMAVLVVCLGIVLQSASVAAAQSPAPYGLNDAGGFRNVLPPGEAGVDNAVGFAAFEALGTIPPHFNDQMAMYENLLQADPTLNDGEIPNYFKDATFGVQDAQVASTESPEPGTTIVRDNYDVPHIYGQTRAELMFGAGYAAAEDRLFLMDVLRHTARAELSSFVGGSPSNRAMDENQWAIAPYTEQDLQSQLDAAQSEYGAAGAQVVGDVQSYVAGINAYIDASKLDPLLLPAEYVAIEKSPQPWTATDVIATSSLIGGIFGKGGGNELRSALALQSLERRFGRKSGERAWTDLREANDPEAPTTIGGRRFSYETGNPFAPRGLALPDRGSVSFTAVGSLSGAAASSRSRATASGPFANLGAGLRGALEGSTYESNWELVSARHSVTGHPLAVLGPQVGYYVPQILMEEDLHGPGIDARGAAFPGVSLYVELGHGRDYAWSATTSTSDNIDTVAEVLCQDAYHYRYRGQCLPMEKLVRSNSWTPNLDDHTAAGAETLTAFRTVHGIVYARGTVHGRPVAFVHARSTYFHEADSAVGFSELNDPYYVTGPASFQSAAANINFLFNWAYVDASHISYYMSGWMPQRARATSPDFPILGTGAYDWKGYNPATHTAAWLPAAKHPHVTDPDYLVSWNNKQAPGWSAADDQWGYGPIHRQQMIGDRVRSDIAGGRRMTISQLVQTMEEPASEDLRAVKLLPILLRAIGTPRGSGLRQAVSELAAWRTAGGHRRDLLGAGHDQYTPAIELMDAWWPKLLSAEFGPMLGSGALSAVHAMLPYGLETYGGDQFGSGWWGYASKDLRRLFGAETKRARYSRVYCGGLPHRRFSLRKLRARCRAALRASLAAAVRVTPAQLYGNLCPNDPEPACADRDTWTYASAITLPPFPFQNRPTFQQVVTLTRQLPR